MSSITINKTNNILDDIPVIAYDFTTRIKIKEFSSTLKAARGLFIKSRNSVNSYLNKKQGIVKEHTKGVKSYKTGKVYHFEYKSTKQ